ncbi:MAG: hypothetical protein UV38_C0003G0078 [candidate division TM6 bacterium GW2011_GWE2_42_60]|nr:MAG: hypothetical protein UV38_C0003G0078 [candidate division TM6 bacterium GW2011_GWE2_42_60]HBY05442.1 hypothetical protein [Candidatus Dependentiae bacterium]
MKKTYLFCASLSFLLTLNSQAKLAPIAMDSTILHFVDTASFIDIKQIFGYANNLIGERTGYKTVELAEQATAAYGIDLPLPLAGNQANLSRIGIILYQNRYTTIHELAELERSQQGDPEELKLALKRAVTAFEKFSADYIEEIQVGKAYMVKLIDQWSILRDRPDTPLCEWSKLNHNETTSMHQTMTSFHIFDRLLDDLLIFLADLVQNCPKSHKAYRESLKSRGATN